MKGASACQRGGGHKGVAEDSWGKEEWVFLSFFND